MSTPPGLVTEDVRSLFDLRMIDFFRQEGECDCCGNVSDLGPMIRPGASVLSDDQLCQMMDELGEVHTMDHYEKSQQQTTTHECDSCRSLDDERYFIILTVKEDR